MRNNFFLLNSHILSGLKPTNVYRPLIFPFSTDSKIKLFFLFKKLSMTFSIIILSLKQLQDSHRKYDFYVRTNLSTFPIFDKLEQSLKTLPYKTENIYTGHIMLTIPDNISFISGTSIIMNQLSFHVSKEKIRKKGLVLNSKIDKDIKDTLKLLSNI